MGWLKYSDKISPDHKCSLPNHDHQEDMWQCDDCLQVWVVMRENTSIPYLYWKRITYQQALALLPAKEATRVHLRNATR